MVPVPRSLALPVSLPSMRPPVRLTLPQLMTIWRLTTSIPLAFPIPDSHDPADCVVWANRGGGKTFLGAVATMLDLVFKPGIQVRILVCSLEQSKRMQDHLTRLFEHERLAPLLKPGRAGRAARSVTLANGSRAEILAASETSVRGVRVQKVRCDEVELFTPSLWRAVQLTTRSLNVSGPWGPTVRGSIEALSTMHLPYGIMWDLVGAGIGGSEIGRAHV